MSVHGVCCIQPLWYYIGDDFVSQKLTFYIYLPADRHTISETTLSVSNLPFTSYFLTDRHTISETILSVSARVHFNKFGKSSESLQKAHRVLQKIDLSNHKATVCCLVLRMCALTQSDKTRSSAMQSGLERVIATPAGCGCAQDCRAVCRILCCLQSLCYCHPFAPRGHARGLPGP